MRAADKSEQLRVLFHSGRRRNYKKNDTILRPDDIPDGVYLIEDGFIKIYSINKRGTQHVHHFFGSGDFFPMAWTLTGRRRHLFYEAISPVTIRLIERQEFWDLINSNLDVVVELLEEMVDRFLLYAGRLDNLLYSDARERCAYRLLSLANRFGAQTDAGLVIDAAITHEDLAHSINMTRETFGRCLNGFQRRGIVDYDQQRRIVIKDLPALIKKVGHTEVETMWPALFRFMN